MRVLKAWAKQAIAYGIIFLLLSISVVVSVIVLKTCDVSENMGVFLFLYAIAGSIVSWVFLILAGNACDTHLDAWITEKWYRLTHWGSIEMMVENIRTWFTTDTYIEDKKGKEDGDQGLD